MAIKKTGTWSGSRITNYWLNYITEPNIIQEPDGSFWLQIFHHNNPASVKFSSTDTFTTGVYKDTDRWFNCNLCSQFSKWELLIKQMAASDGTEQKFRWIQTVNPMTAAFGDVDTADITQITTAGYSTPTSPYNGGLYLKNSSTYLCQNNANSGNWWGAIGSWTDYSSAIPAWGGVKVTTGYVDLYIRLDNDSLILQEGKTKIRNTQEVVANDFYEI